MKLRRKEHLDALPVVAPIKSRTTKVISPVDEARKSDGIQGPSPLVRIEDFVLSIFRSRPSGLIATAILSASLLPVVVGGAPIKSFQDPTPTKITAPAAKTLASPGFKTIVAKGVKGAFFRKVASPASTKYGGIEASGTLPTPSFDPNRYYLAKEGLDHFTTGPLERPSVYLGGRASGREVDAGLTWDRVYDSSGQATYTDRAGTDGRDASHRFVESTKAGKPVVLDGDGKVVAEGKDAVAAKMKPLVPNFAFRIYWRTTNPGEEGWHQPEPGAANNAYFYPGEQFTMKVSLMGPGKVELAVGRAAEDAVVIPFHQEDWGGKKTAHVFKRVNALDQFQILPDGSRKGREKQNVLPTATTAVGASWSSVTLLDRNGKSLTPMTGKAFTEYRGQDTAPHYNKIFARTGFTDRGGEKLDIIPNGK